MSSSAERIEQGSERAIAVLVCRDGRLPAGADEATAEAGGRAIVVGTGGEAAARSLTAASEALVAEMGPFAPGAYAVTITPLLESLAVDVAVLPGTPDGRDLAPRLAHRLGWPLLAGALRVRGSHVLLSRFDGRVLEEVDVNGPYITTLIPGVRGSVPVRDAPTISIVEISPDPSTIDAESIAVLAPDPATMDLTEAVRILSGGQGLGSAERFELLGRIATALGASLGGTRVASDAGWIPFERQIGTTGVAVNPRLYLAFGVSGATQHTTGLGHPDHIVSVNLDGSCPMMAMADLAIVSDARAVLDELACRLGLPLSAG